MLKNLLYEFKMTYKSEKKYKSLVMFNNAYFEYYGGPTLLNKIHLIELQVSKYRNLKA